jgi:hypothetical protein
MTLSINVTQHNSIKCRYAECGNFYIVVLSVVMLNVVVPTHKDIQHNNK